jgi:hypothetical protein
MTKGYMNEKSKNQLKVDELFGVFDLGFSDAFTQDSVRNQTFKHKLDGLTDAMKVINGDSILNYALFIELGDSHPTPRLWLECETDLRGSIYLALGGYYRQALICLRTWLELTLIGIYYNCHYTGENSRFEKWKRGQRRSPGWRQLLGALFKRPRLQNADVNIALQDKLRVFYDELSCFVHGRGIELYELQRGRDNVPRFLEHSFDMWLRFLKQTYGLLLLTLFAEYGQPLDSYFRRNPTEAQRLAEVLPAEVRTEWKLLRRKVND